jgi:hypothetical protein
MLGGKNDLVLTRLASTERVQVAFSHYFCWGGSSNRRVRFKGGGRAPPPRTLSWAENTIMTECTHMAIASLCALSCLLV